MNQPRRRLSLDAITCRPVRGCSPRATGRTIGAHRGTAAILSRERKRPGRSEPSDRLIGEAGLLRLGNRRLGRCLGRLSLVRWRSPRFRSERPHALPGRDALLGRGALGLGFAGRLDALAVETGDTQPVEHLEAHAVGDDLQEDLALRLARDRPREAHDPAVATKGDAEEVGIAVRSDPLADRFGQLLVVEVEVLMRDRTMRARLEAPQRRPPGGLGPALACEAVSRLGDRAEPLESDGHMAAFAHPVGAGRDLRERTVDFLELVPVALPNTVEEASHRLSLAARLELGLTILLDGAEVGFQAVDVVEERALPVQQLAANAFELRSGNRVRHRILSAEKADQFPCQPCLRRRGPAARVVLRRQPCGRVSWFSSPGARSLAGWPVPWPVPCYSVESVWRSDRAAPALPA